MWLTCSLCSYLYSVICFCNYKFILIKPYKTLKLHKFYNTCFRIVFLALFILFGFGLWASCRPCKMTILPTFFIFLLTLYKNSCNHNNGQKLTTNDLFEGGQRSDVMKGFKAQRYVIFHSTKLRVIYLMQNWLF